MSYIQNEQHFINYLNKSIRDNSELLEQDRIMTSEFYLEKIYEKGLADKYTWSLWDNIFYLYEENVVDFIRNGTWCSKECDELWTEEFKDFVKRLFKITGVYLFETKRKNSLYVGFSTNLYERIMTSFNERFSTYNQEIYLKCITCNSPIDARIIEIYCIGKHKPALNVDAKYKGNMTLEVKNIPQFTKRVLCKNDSKA